MGPATRARARCLLLLAACWCCLLAPRGADCAGSGTLVDADRFTYAHVEPMSNAEAAAASVDFIAAEAAAGAAEAKMTGTPAPAAAGSSAEEWEVWDTEDEDEKPPPVSSGREPADAFARRPPRPPPAPPAPPQPPQPSPVAAPLDALFDFALGVAVHQIAAQHGAEQPVPDFKKEFHARLGPLRVHGHLDAQGGTAGDLTSLFRDGTATLRQEKGGVLVLEAAAGLRHLRLRYRHYSARAGPIRVSGTLEAETSPATLRAQLALVPPCGVQLRALSVAHVGPLRVQASGLGALRRLLPLLQRWLDKKIRGDVERLVVQRLSQIVNGELRRVSCK